MKLIRNIIWLGALALTALGPFAHAQNTEKPFFFRDGDRAVFIGDSITQQHRYSTLIESYVLSRFPTWNISFRHTGWDGDTMAMPSRGGLEGAFARDVAPLRPTAATVDYGMNDGRGGDAAYEAYLTNARALTGKLKEFGSRVTLVSPSPEEKYEAGMPAGSSYNNMLLKYSDGLQQVATETDVPYIDQIRPMIATIEASRSASVLGATGDPRLIPDGVHPSWAGHLVMATYLLKGLNAPALVSSVEINAAEGPRYQAKTQNATVTPLEVSSGAGATVPLTFTRLDNALPWPIHPETKLAQSLPGITPLQDLSRYELKIANLAAPRYEIRIDDIAVGTWTKEELAAGINLSQAPGPIHDQAQKLLQKILEKNKLFYNRWRNVQLFRVPVWLQTPEAEAARAAELARLDAQIAAFEVEINELRKPVAHTWTVAPI
ncbi:MAG TPA: SGNH/GDSL hydrolase family protein [Chthoniobacterales bacterium]|jgi:lysophospholipase L1-like esterase